jgi:hypothetical protein
MLCEVGLNAPWRSHGSRLEHDAQPASARESTIPSNDQSPPQEIFGTMKEVLLQHFRHKDEDAPKPIVLPKRGQNWVRRAPPHGPSQAGFGGHD